jgi:hypothetical protein
VGCVAEPGCGVCAWLCGVLWSVVCGPEFDWGASGNSTAVCARALETMNEKVRISAKDPALRRHKGFTAIKQGLRKQPAQPLFRLRRTNLGILYRRTIQTQKLSKS